MRKEFKVGDKVRIDYITDCNPQNGKVATITWLHDYTETDGTKKTQAELDYGFGQKMLVDNIYREGSGLVSPVQLVNNQQILGLGFEKYWDIVNEYAYDLDRFSTHDELLAALKKDTRIKKSEDNVPYYDLISEIISKGEGCVCDLCDSIFALDDAFDIDYADPDDEDDMKILKGLKDIEGGENVVCICQDCYHKLLNAEDK